MNTRERTYAHETGHLLGLADRYLVYEHRKDPTDTFTTLRPGTEPNDLMGTGNQVSQKGINALLEYGVNNQTNGKTIITRENLRRNGKPDLLNGDYDILKLKDVPHYRISDNLTH